MAGLAGRIKYLYEGDITFLELKTIIENISKNNIPLFEKVDGFNCYFSCRRGMPVMARNLTEARAGGLSIVELSNREFKGGHKVKRVFIQALKNFSNDFKLLNKSVFENNGKQVFYNFEIVDKNTNRLFEYDNNGLILHNSGHFYISDNEKHFINREMFKEGSIETKYIKQNFKTCLKENSQFNSKKVIEGIESVVIMNGLTFENSILEVKDKHLLTKVINEFSNSLINSLQSNFINEQDVKVNQFKKRVKEVINSLLEYNGPNRAEVVEKTIHYLNQFPAIDSINSCIEGVVFEHKGEMYKLTGYYGPINQLYGFYQKTLNEFDSGKMYPIEPNSYNVDGVLTHPQEKTIAVFPGSFKPPHAGHYRIIEELKNLKTPDGFHICNKIIILISNKARMAQSDSKTTYVTADIAKELWDLYVSNEDAQTRIEIRISEHDTPIKSVYDLMLNEMSPGETLLLVKSDKDGDSDRFNAFEDFSNEYDLGIKVIQKGMNVFSAGISASNMRNWIADGNSERFKGFLPDHLSSDDRERAWEIVSGAKEVPLSVDNSFFLNEFLIQENVSSAHNLLKPEYRGLVFQVFINHNLNGYVIIDPADNSQFINVNYEPVNVPNNAYLQPVPEEELPTEFHELLSDNEIIYPFNKQEDFEIPEINFKFIFTKNGTKYWFFNGKLHREDGPAIEYAKGNKEWWINGQRHREDGPAIEYADGIYKDLGLTKEWYLNDINYTEEEFNQITQKQPLNEIEILEEGAGDTRLKNALKKYPQYSEQIEAMAKAEPSGKGLKLLPWMVRELVKFEGKRVNDIIAVISLFWQYRQRFEAAGYSTDVFAWPFEEMLGLLNRSRLTPIFDKVKSPLRTSEYPGSSVVYENEDYAVIRPYTFDASCYFGEKGVWCISMNEKHWNDYVNREAVHYILINDSIKFKEDPNAKIDFVVEGGFVEELWDKNNKSLEVDYVKNILGEELYNEIEKEILEDYERDPNNERDGNEKEWLELKTDIRNDFQNRKYIKCDVFQYNDYDSNSYMFDAEFRLNLDDFKLRFINDAKLWNNRKKITDIIYDFLNQGIEGIEITGNHLIAKLYFEDDGGFDLENARYYFENLTEKDNELQGDDNSNNIFALLQKLWAGEFIVDEDNNFDTKMEILNKIADYDDFKYIFTDIDEEDGFEAQFVIPAFPLPILPNQCLVSDLKKISFPGSILPKQTFLAADIKKHTQDFFKRFGFPNSITSATNFEFPPEGDTSFAIVDKELNIDIFAIRDLSSDGSFAEVDQKTQKAIADMQEDPDFLNGEKFLVEFKTKDGNLTNSANNYIKCFINIKFSDLLNLSTEELSVLLEKLIILDQSDEIPKFKIQETQILKEARDSILREEVSKINEDIVRRFIYKYYLTNNLKESFSEKILEKCCSDKTVFVWNPSNSKEMDQNFLEAKLKGIERGIDTSGLYYANMNELFMLENDLIEEEINGNSSKEYAVIPKMNTKAHWYFNNLKSENKLASRSLGQFHMLMENRIDFLIKTYREKIFEKIINNLSKFYMSEITHLNWDWIGPYIIQAVDIASRKDPESGEEFLSSIKEEDVERLKDQAFEFFVNTDPSQKKKYVQWLISKFLKDDERIEDIWSSKGNLELFDEMARRNIIRGIDINSLSLNDLRKIVDEYEGELSGRQKQGKSDNEKEYIIKNEMDVLFQQGEFVMAIPKTERASCLLGSKTNWCTASRGERNKFKHYNDDGPLIVFLTPFEKRQLHIESDQFKEENDKKDEFIPWLERNSIFKKPLLKYLLNNGWTEHGKQQSSGDSRSRSLYNQYFSGNQIDEDITTFIFKETLTTQKMIELLSDDSKKIGSDVTNVTEQNQILFELLWNSNLEELKTKWIKKSISAINNVKKESDLHKATYDFRELYIELMPPDLFKDLVVPEFFNQENLSSAKHLTPIVSNSIRYKTNNEKEVQNLLTILEESIKNNLDSSNVFFDIIESDESFFWIRKIFKKPILYKWFEKEFDNLRLEYQAEFSFRTLGKSFFKTTPENNHLQIDADSVKKFFILKFKETLLEVLSQGRLITNIMTPDSTWRKINNLDPEIANIYAETFIQYINKELNNPEYVYGAQPLHTEKNRLLFIYGNLVGRDGDYIGGVPQFKKIIKPLEEYIEKYIGTSYLKFKDT